MVISYIFKFQVVRKEISKFNSIEGYMERNSLLERQDAIEQRQHMDCLILRGSKIPDPEESPDLERMKIAMSSAISKLAEAECIPEDLDLVSIRSHFGKSTDENENEVYFTSFLLV